MPFPQSRSRISIEEICLYFYRSKIMPGFNIIVSLNKYLREINTLYKVDLDVFNIELTALRFELFGLALWNRNQNLMIFNKQWQNKQKYEQLLKDTCYEIVITKKYLEIHGGAKVWNAMGYYNKEAYQAIYTETLHTEDNRREEFTWRERLQKYTYKDFRRYLSNPLYISRLENRTPCSEEEWNDGRIPNRLVRLFAERINCLQHMDWEAILRLQSLILGFYNDIRMFMGEIAFSDEYQERIKRESRSFGNILIKVRNEIKKEAKSPGLLSVIN